MNTHPAQLVALFNAGYDYAVRQGDTWVAHPKEHATHSLICTAWNTMPKGSSRQALRDRKTLPDGYALSVCAVPLKPLSDRTSVRLAKPIAELPVYERRGTLAGKRAVLSVMVESHGTPTKMRRLIAKLGNEHCDRLYKSLLRANRRARRRLRKLKKG